MPSRTWCGSNLRCSTSVVESVRPRLKCARPQEWNIGAAIIVRSRARSGIMSSRAAAGSSDDGWCRPAPFGVPVVPLVRMTTRPGRSGGVSGGVVLARRDVLRHVAVHPGRGLRDELGELRVVDHRRRGLLAAHLRDLRPGEGGVQVQHVGAGLGRRERRLHEAAVVAAQDRDRAARAEAVGPPAVRDRVRPAVELGEADRAELVDDRRLVRVAGRAHAIAGRRGLPPRAQGLDGAQQPIGARGLRDAGPSQRPHREELRAESGQGHVGREITADEGRTARCRRR